MAILYAWVAPAFIQGSPADHTWVTSFDSRQDIYPDIGAVVAANENFWFCWGQYRPQGNPPPPIAAQAGDLNLAICLVAPNRESKPYIPARGTIMTYAIDGVCHQLANQVLFATAGPGCLPATVVHARLYWFSSFLYGDYGRRTNEWRNKIAFCSGGAAGDPGDRAMPDDMFDARMRAALGDDDPRLEAMSGLREEHELAVQQLGLDDADDPEAAAAAMNALNQQFFDLAADLLGEEQFALVFGMPAYTRINLVDPDQLGATDGAPTPLRG